jgi:hypothetical protein
MLEHLKTMKTGIDWHAAAGILGTGLAFGLGDFSTIAAGCAATATALYMLLRIAREWRRMRRESRGQVPLCENFKPATKIPQKKTPN